MRSSSPGEPPRRGGPHLISLLTDFGLEDIYVGVMKGVIAGLAPRAPVVDITHGIASQDVIQGGLRWRGAVPYFPPGSVHVAVVDPGVGGDRAILAARARGSVFLAPDNGLLGFVAEPPELEEVVRVEDERHFLPRVSRTFHGRDIFAPVAARLALGLPLSRLGPPAPGYLPAPLPPLEERPGRRGVLLRGQVVDVDKFGNCITNIPAPATGVLTEVRVGKRRLVGLVDSYGQGRPGQAIALIGSLGFLEIAVNRGRADRVLGLRRGAGVTALVVPSGPPAVRGGGSGTGREEGRRAW